MTSQASYTGVVLALLLLVCGYLGIGSEHDEGSTVIHCARHHLPVIHIPDALLLDFAISHGEVGLAHLAALFFNHRVVERVYELVALPFACTGLRTGHRRRDVADLRREPRREARGPARQGAPGQLPSASGQTYLHSEGRWLETTAEHSVPGGQNRPTGGRDGSRSNLREDFLGFSYGFRPRRGQHDARWTPSM